VFAAEGEDDTGVVRRGSLLLDQTTETRAFLFVFREGPKHGAGGRGGREGGREGGKEGW